MSADTSSEPRRGKVFIAHLGLKIALWFYLLLNVPYLTIDPIVIDGYVGACRDRAAKCRAQGDTEQASNLEREADERHRDRVQSTNAAWVGLGVGLVGLAIVHGRRS
jgi:hypothetical protein